MKHSLAYLLLYFPLLRKKIELTRAATRFCVFPEERLQQHESFLLKHQEVLSEKDLGKEIRQAIDQIRINNSFVALFDDTLSQYRIEDIIQEPKERMSKEKADEIISFSTKSPLVNKLDATRKREYQALKDLCEDYSNLVSQKDLLDRIAREAKSNPTHYVDDWEKTAFLDEYQEELKSITGKTGLHYPFPTREYLAKEIANRNQKYLDIYKTIPLFDDVHGRSLDEDQRKAALIDERSNLVIAGAGCGKTLTICAKLSFLKNVMNVHPKDVLILSFSNKSVQDLNEKVTGIDPLFKAVTFHKLGLEILEKCTGKKATVEEQFEAILESYFHTGILEDEEAKKDLLEYLSLYERPMDSNEEELTEGEQIALRKNDPLWTLKDKMRLTNQERYTLKRELVKSLQEWQIANWYYLNGIDYAYEKPYPIDVSSETRRQYLPDFTLTQKGIYHEHYGIDKDGRTPQFNERESQKYLDTMKWKRDFHKNHKTTCIETYSYEFHDGTIFKHLKERLREQGIEVQPLTPERESEILACLSERNSFRSFLSLVKTFLSLYKSKYDSEEGFAEIAVRQSRGSYESKRARLFLKIAKKTYVHYRNHLRCEKKIDFDDMILQSRKALKHLDGYRYRYILIDEFQDISTSRMLFLQSLIEHGNSKLYAVGDDWQSIYRFTGSELDIFVRFQNYFGVSETTSIRTTHRNSQELLDIAGPFVMKNPLQIKKKLQSFAHQEKPIRAFLYPSKKKDWAFLEILNDIRQQDSKANILILGRNNRDLESLSQQLAHSRKQREKKNGKSLRIPEFPDFTIRFSTIHASKGLEEDYVILVNMQDDFTGFPNKMEDDPILDCLHDSQESFPFVEERRLFYVALTRARRITYLLVPKDNPSCFFKEIQNRVALLPGSLSFQTDRTSDVLCPQCHTGHLIYHPGADGKRPFYYCSNYPYCRYSTHAIEDVRRNLRCPVCGNFLAIRQGRSGKFYGCHSYPDCHYTHPIPKD